MWSRLVSLLVPPVCVACRAATGGDALCPDCRRALPWLAGGCPRCALPRCGDRGRCPMARGAVSAAWAPMAHAGPARALVVALKFRGALALADLMAAQIAAGAPPELLSGTLVAVPAPAARRRARGFDPPAVLAPALARRTGLPIAACLARGDAGARQLGASRAARVAGGPSLVVRGDPPRRAVLVDAVHTTGGTLRACAAALRAAGAERIVAVTYSRAL